MTAVALIMLHAAPLDDVSIKGTKYGCRTVNIDKAAKPTAHEIEAAGNAARALLRVDSSCPIQPILEGTCEDVIRLPARVFNSIVKMLIEIGNGHAIAVMPAQAELTTSQAADLPNMSRPHPIKLLDRGDLPFRMLSTHR